MCLRKLQFATINKLVGAFAELIREREFLNVLMLCGWVSDMTKIVCKYEKSMDSQSVKELWGAMKELVEDTKESEEYREVAKKCIAAMNKHLK